MRHLRILNFNDFLRTLRFNFDKLGYIFYHDNGEGKLVVVFSIQNTIGEFTFEFASGDFDFDTELRRLKSNVGHSKGKARSQGIVSQALLIEAFPVRTKG